MHKLHLYAVMESVKVFTKSIMTNCGGEYSHEKGSRVKYTMFVVLNINFHSQNRLNILLSNKDFVIQQSEEVPQRSHQRMLKCGTENVPDGPRSSWLSS